LINSAIGISVAMNDPPF